MFSKKLHAFIAGRLEEGRTIREIDEELRAPSTIETLGRAATRIDLLDIIQSLTNGADLTEPQTEEEPDDGVELLEDRVYEEEDHCDDCRERCEDCMCDDDEDGWE